MVAVIRCRATRHALTLVEVLVVIAVIGVLVGLLLPAVQAAREAANAAQCANNLKQVGLALQLHHDATKQLPVGAKYQNRYGTSWMVALLPYLEEQALHDQFDHTSKDNGHPSKNANNGQLVDEVVLSVLQCPSSPLPSLWPVGSYEVMLPSYVGISGSTNEDGLTGSLVSPCCAPGPYGEVSASGVLLPNAAVRLADVTDGLSKTICVGEASDFAIDAFGGKRNMSGGFNHGWITGAMAQGVPPNYPTSGPAMPIYNLATIKYRPGTTKYETAGVRDNHGPNNPLLSAHPESVHVLLLDGSVSRVQNQVDMLTLRRLANRADGGAVGAF